MKLSKTIDAVINAGVSLGIGLGILGAVLGNFFSSLPVNSVGADFVNSVIGAFQTAVTNSLGGVVGILFVVMLYVAVKAGGLLNHTKEG